MKSKFPISSEEFNDKLLLAYERYVKLLGYTNENEILVTPGLYRELEDNINSNYKEYILSLSQ